MGGMSWARSWKSPCVQPTRLKAGELWILFSPRLLTLTLSSLLFLQLARSAVSTPGLDAGHKSSRQRLLTSCPYRFLIGGAPTARLILR
jgi:hypothetical protein